MLSSFDQSAVIEIDARKEMNSAGRVPLPFALISRNEGCGVKSITLLSHTNVQYPSITNPLTLTKLSYV